jgi:hypothetical protein
VLETSQKVEAKLQLQVYVPLFVMCMSDSFAVENSASITFKQTATNPGPFLKIVTQTALRWGKEGWGGHIGVSPKFIISFCIVFKYHQANNLINVNPKLTLDEAKASLKNVSDYALSQNGTVTIETMPSWNTFFQKYVVGAQAVSHLIRSTVLRD